MDELLAAWSGAHARWIVARTNRDDMLTDLYYWRMVELEWRVCMELELVESFETGDAP